MRKTLTLTISALSAALLLVTAAPAVAVDGTVRGVTVQAIGQIKVTPDAANVTYAVSLMRQSNSEALAAVNAVQAQARALVLAAGIKRENITTTGLSVFPEYYYPEGAKEPVIVGYRASQSTTVAIYSIDKAETVVDGLAAISDDVRIGGISLFIADPTKYEAKMRQIAVAKAKAKAASYAKLVGRKLGSVQYITELSAPVSTYRWDQAMSSPEAGKTQIDPGLQTVGITVEIRWSLR
jgi:uncharacterized protein